MMQSHFSAEASALASALANSDSVSPMWYSPADSSSSQPWSHAPCQASPQVNARTSIEASPLLLAKRDVVNIQPWEPTFSTDTQKPLQQTTDTNSQHTDANAQRIQIMQNTIKQLRQQSEDSAQKVANKDNILKAIYAILGRPRNHIFTEHDATHYAQNVIQNHIKRHPTPATVTEALPLLFVKTAIQAINSRQLLSYPLTIDTLDPVNNTTQPLTFRTTFSAPTEPSPEDQIKHLKRLNSQSTETLRQLATSHHTLLTENTSMMSTIAALQGQLTTAQPTQPKRLKKKPASKKATKNVALHS